MDFHHRARNALERGEPVRALVQLVQGLRRNPDHEDGLDLFLFIYTQRIDKPGLESDLLRGLEFQPDQSQLLRLVIDELRELGKDDMAEAVESLAEQEGVTIAAPPPDPADLADGDGDGDCDGEKSPDGPDAAARAAILADGGSIDRQKGVGDAADDLKSPKGREEGRGRSSSTRGPGSWPKDGAEKIDAELSTAERARRRARRPAKRRIFAIVVVSFVVIVAGCILFMGWHHTKELRRIAMVDAAMSAFDPLDPETAYHALDHQSLSPGARQDPEIGERRQFISAVLALEGGRNPDQIEIASEPSTAWGYAAAALTAAYNRDWEEAMRFAHFLENAYGDTLPAFFARARICEARGEWECAVARYSRIQQHFEDFIPARTGAMRVAASRFDLEAFSQEQGKLAQRNPNHVYVGLPWIDPFTLQVDAVEEAAIYEGGDRFLMAWARVAEATTQLQTHGWEESSELCQSVLSELEWQLPTAKVVCARARAGMLDARGSRDFFDAAARRPDLASSFYRDIQVLAPRLLTDLGRADWALIFTIPDEYRGLAAEPTDDGPDFVTNREAARPGHFEPAPAGDMTAHAALLVLGQTLTALGAGQRARSTLERLLTDEEFADRARYEIVQTYLVEGNAAGAKRGAAQIGDERLQAAALAQIAYLEGRHVDAQEFVWENGDDPRALRIRVLAFLADGRGRDALTALESVDDGLDYLSLVPVRHRVDARARDGDNASALRELLPDPGDVRSIDHLVDLAGAAFWSRELERCGHYLERALELAPRHPEANWKMGLLRRVQGQTSQARSHFGRAWRGDENSAYLLVELGRVHLEYGRYDQAREVFLRAAFRDRRNLEALAGLGMAYYRGDRPRGRRDLAQVLGNYSNTPRNAPARAELNLWLAIVHGSRDGEEEAHLFLQRAREAVGDRPDILVEKARYFQARQEWAEARQFYGLALQRDPTYPETHLGLAQVARATGELDAARTHLERLLGLISGGDLMDQARALLAELNGESP